MSLSLGINFARMKVPGFQEALLLKGLKIVFERPWQCAICKL
jgi:hypothetical protein